MKNCPKCGDLCSDSSRFCSSCGYSFEESASVEPSTRSLEPETANEVKKGTLTLIRIADQEADQSPAAVYIDDVYAGELHYDSEESFEVDYGAHTVILDTGSRKRGKKFEITENDPHQEYKFSLRTQAESRKKAAAPAKKKSSHLVSKIICTILVLFAAFSLFTTKSGSPVSAVTSPKPVSSVQNASGTDTAAVSTTESAAPSASDTGNTRETVSEPQSGSNEAIEEAVILDQEGICITAKSIDRSSAFGPTLKLLIENDSPSGITVQARNASVNGYMIETMMSEDVASGKKVNSGLTFSNSGLKTAGITTIADLQFSFHIFDSSSWETIIDSRPIDIKTSAAQDYPYPFDDSGITVYEGNDIRIIAKGLTTDTSLFGPSIKVYIENNRNDAITVQARDVSVNGFMVEAIFSSDIAPGKKCMDTITFMRSDLTENGITDINEVDLYFHIFSAETWNEIVDTQPIKLTF